MTKTNEVKYHNPECNYRKTMNKIEEQFIPKTASQLAASFEASFERGESEYHRFKEIVDYLADLENRVKDSEAYINYLKYKAT